MRLLATGWEAGHLEEIPHSIGFGAQCTISITTSGVRNGDRCLKFAGVYPYPVGYYVWSMPVSKTEIWTRFGFKVAIAGAHQSTDEAVFLTFFDANGDETLKMRYNRLSGAIEALRGSTVIGTSSGALSLSSAGTWHLIEVRYKPHNSTGVVELYLNGVLVMNIASGDTTNALENVLSIGLKLDVEGDNLPTSGSPYLDHYFDDWVVNDTTGAVNNGRPNDGAILMLQPTGAGSSTQLTRGGADSGANWSQVDEIPPDDGDYVYSSTIAQRDLYAIENLPSGVGTIFSVAVLARAREEISGVGKIGLTQKSGATITEDTADDLESTFKYFADLREVNPATAVAYTTTEIDAIEAGVTVR